MEENVEKKEEKKKEKIINIKVDNGLNPESRNEVPIQGFTHCYVDNRNNFYSTHGHPVKLDVDSKKYKLTRKEENKDPIKVYFDINFLIDLIKDQGGKVIQDEIANGVVVKEAYKIAQEKQKKYLSEHKDPKYVNPKNLAEKVKNERDPKKSRSNIKNKNGASNKATSAKQRGTVDGPYETMQIDVMGIARSFLKLMKFNPTESDMVDISNAINAVIRVKSSAESVRA